MSSITIKDLPESRALDRAAMRAIRGGGAPWVYGWIQPFVAQSPSATPTVNFYQINNFADQMINQIQVVNVTNSAANSNVDVGLDENSRNRK